MAEPKGFNDYLLGPQVGEYPKALYRLAMTSKGERGDVISPGYEKIVTNDSGIAQRLVEYHVYVTRKAADAKQEKEMLKEGWVDHPDKLKVEVAA
jgi:hypothetical protein